MKKWYQSCRWMLLATLVTGMVGCAQNSWWLGRSSHRDHSDKKLVDVDGKAKSKSDSGKSSIAKKSDRKESGSSWWFAKKATDKPKAPSGKSTDTKIASTPKKKSSAYDDSTLAKKSDKSRTVRDPFLDEDYDSLETTKPSTNRWAERRREEAELAVAEAKRKSAAANSDLDSLEDELDREIAQASASNIKQEAARNASALESEVTTRKATVKKKIEDDLADLEGLDDWATEPKSKTASSPAKSPVKEKTAKQAQNDAEEVLDPFREDYEELRSTAKKTVSRVTNPDAELDWGDEPIVPKVNPKATVNKSIERVKSTAEARQATLLSLCPDARNEIREAIGRLDTIDTEALKREIHQLGRRGVDARASAPALQKLLSHEDGFVRTHAALALARMKKPSVDAVQAVVDGLKSSDPSLRSFAASTLGEMGPQAGQALAALAESLDDRDGYIRLHAAEVLIRHDEFAYRALETLIECLKDKDENVRWLATYSLAEQAPQAPEVVSALVKTTRDPVQKVQIGAVYALGELGPYAKKAAGSLKKLANETADTELQSAISYALQQMER